MKRTRLHTRKRTAVSVASAPPEATTLVDRAGNFLITRAADNLVVRS